MERTQDERQTADMQRLSEIYQYTNKTVIVIAAGPSAAKDVMTLHDIAVGINHHSDYFLEFTDYNVFIDTPSEDTPATFNAMANEVGKRVCPNSKYSDYDFDIPWPDLGCTAPLAVWFGLHITSGPVLLAGFDLWQSKDTQTHFYKHEPETTTHLGDLDHELKLWGDFFQTVDKDRLTALSGPLQQIL